MKAYSEDLRLKIAKAEGLYEEIAKVFNVSLSTVSKYKNQLLKEGNVKAKWSKTNKKRLLNQEHELSLSNHIEINPNLTLSELVKWINNEHGIIISKSALHNYLRKIRISYKKKF